MTKEELKQKAYEYAIKEIPFIECITQNDLEILVQQAYITGAEPREKRIAKLESQNKELKKWLKEKFESCASENLSFVAKYDTVCQELDSCKAKIAELEAQIEKMKCCKEEIIKALKETLDYEWLHAHNGKAKYVYLQTVIDVVNEKFKEIKEK